MHAKGGYRNNKKGGLKGGSGGSAPGENVRVFEFNPGLYTIFTSLIHFGRLCSTKIICTINPRSMIL